MKLTLIAAAALVALPMSAATFKVESITKVPLAKGVTAYHPVFTADGRNLLVSSENYNGLSLLSAETGAVKAITDKCGAGYKFSVADDGTSVIFRENDFEAQTMSLFAANIATGEQQAVALNVQHANNLMFNGQQLTLEQNGQMERRLVTAPGVMQTMSSATTPATYVTEEDLKMVVYNNGVRSVVDPILSTTGDDVNYCWTSLSPDGTRLLFVAHNTAYTSNLDGSDLVNLGKIHAPVWRDNNYVVAMLDSDDGHNFTTSEIVIADARNAKMQQLTPADEAIKMFPAVSPDGNNIAFHTLDGEIYIIKITE